MSFLFFLNETAFAILSSQRAALTDIYWALHDPFLPSSAWLIGIIERSPAPAGWGPPLLGQSLPAHLGLPLHSLAASRQDEAALSEAGGCPTVFQHKHH